MVESKLDWEGGEDRGVVELTYRTVIHGLEVLRSQRRVTDGYLNKPASQVGLTSFQSGACQL